MVTIHPQFITDKAGKKIAAVLPMKEFKAILEELEEKEEIRRYDEAKKQDNGERILFSEYLKSRKKRHA